MAAVPEPVALRGPQGTRDAVVSPRFSLPPCTPAELRALVHAGENDSDACERLLAAVAREQGAIELAIGEGLLALGIGDRLISLGFSCRRDYAREVLGVQERKAQTLVQLARELRARPLLRAAVLAGEVRTRHALTVLPVAIGQAEAAWVERACTETVRALEVAVRAARAGGEPEETWSRFGVRLSAEDRAVVDEALDIAGKVLPGASRAERLEAMAQEYLGWHAALAGDDGAGGAGGPFRADALARAAEREAQLEAETGRWEYLPQPPQVPVPPPSCDEYSSAEEIHAALRALAARRDACDDLLGYCALFVRRSGLWRVAGFDSFAHYCTERLGMAPRTVEQRAALEQKLWAVPTLRAARDAGLSYEKVRLLSQLPPREVEGWTLRARALTCVELREALAGREDAQMRAARVLRGRVPDHVARLLQDAFRAVRVVEGRLLDDGRCLVRVAEHFIDAWKTCVKKARTVSQKVRERDLERCQVPGCSRRAVHGHHVVPRARGGSDAPWNRTPMCAGHHLRGVHGGYLRVSGCAPDALVWEVGPWDAPVDLRARCGVEVPAAETARAA